MLFLKPWPLALKKLYILKCCLWQIFVSHDTIPRWQPRTPTAAGYCSVCPSIRLGPLARPEMQLHLLVSLLKERKKVCIAGEGECQDVLYNFVKAQPAGRRGRKLRLLSLCHLSLNESFNRALSHPPPHRMLLPVSAEGTEPSPIFVTCPVGAIGDVITRPTLPSELNASDQSLLGEERAASQASSLNYTELIIKG